MDLMTNNITNIGSKYDTCRTVIIYNPLIQKEIGLVKNQASSDQNRVILTELLFAYFDCLILLY